MNTCQSLVNPDCSKATVQKSLGIRKAIFKALWFTFENLRLEDTADKLLRENLVFIGSIPKDVTKLSSMPQSNLQESNSKQMQLLVHSILNILKTANSDIFFSIIQILSKLLSAKKSIATHLKTSRQLQELKDRSLILILWR